MTLFLRITFTILAALCVAAVIPVGIFFGWIWAGVCILGAFAFYMLMKICKQSMDADVSEQENSVSENNLENNTDNRTENDG